MGSQAVVRRLPRLADSWCQATALLAHCHWPPSTIIGLSLAYDGALQARSGIGPLKAIGLVSAPCGIRAGSSWSHDQWPITLMPLRTSSRCLKRALNPPIQLWQPPRNDITALPASEQAF